jgi:imidazolonepropionase-like amidohydrolase
MRLRALRWITLLISLLVACAAQSSATGLILISNVTIIDCTGRAPSHGMSVVLSEGRIAAIGPASHIKAPANAVVLDGTGKYLIPGLWNMHAHLGSYTDAPQILSEYLAQGVTGIRDMASPLDDILRLRQETDNGRIPGPRLVVAGPIVQGPLPFQMPQFISVNDSAAADATVRMLVRRGVDFIKVQDAIPHDIYVAVARQARESRITFAGHIPPTVLPEEASDFGQKSIEHLGGRFWGVLVGSSTRERELHAKELQMYEEAIQALKRGASPPDLNMRADFTRKIVESYDPRKAAYLLRRFHQNNTWQCPTLVALRTLWTSGGTPYTAEDLHWADRLINRNAEVVAMMQKTGVGLLAGTDLPPNSKDGTIHDELAYLVDAGLTPMQALLTATRNPAKFLGKLSTLGTVEPGKLADLVLLDGNPLDDIHNTRRISAVIVRGRVMSH